jgi:hypothetical protein
MQVTPRPRDATEVDELIKHDRIFAIPAQPAFLQKLLYISSIIILINICATGLYAISTYYYVVPFYDMVKTYNDIFNDPLYLFLIKPENEHVHILAKLFYLADMYFNHGRGTLVLAFMLIFMIVISVIISANIIPNAAKHRFLRLTATTIICMALFLWIDNNENLLWEKQIHIYISFLLFTLSLTVLRGGEISPARFSAIVALSFWTTLSFGYGLAAAITIFLLAVAMRMERHWLIGFALSALAQFGLWRALMTLAVPPYHAYAADSINHPLAIADYLFRFLRIPIERIVIAIFQPTLAQGLATLIAMVGLGLAALAGRSFLAKQERRSDALLGLAFILFGLGNAAVIALARSGPNIPAESSRYMQIAIFFWAGLAIYHLPLLRRWSVLHPLAVATISFLFCTSFAWSEKRDWTAIADNGQAMRSLAVPLLNHVTDDAVLDRLYWDRPTELSVLDELAKRHLSIFSAPDSDLLGRPLADIAAVSPDCAGWVDGSAPAGSSKPYVYLHGWAYRTDRREPPAAIIIVAHGQVVGLGLMTSPRPDVHEARPEFPASGVGWEAAVNQSPPLADYAAYAVGPGPNGRVACPIPKA